MKTIALLLAVSVVASLVAAHEHAASSSKELDRIKALAGDWKGTGMMEGKKAELTTNFRVTAGGSAVVETMDAGTPHEMTNVYHDVDGKLAMTHYCMAGNAPDMRVVKSDGKSLSLAARKGNGIDPEKTPHMHGLSLSFVDKDHMTATWQSANMGPEHMAPAVFNYERVAGR
jgi:hypothetical protein